MLEEPEQTQDDAAETAPEEPAADAAPAEAAEQPAAEQPAGEQPAADAATPPAEEGEQLTPKQRRKRTRAQARGQARAQRSPEERARERDERRASHAAARRRWRAKRRERERAKPRASAAQEPAERGPGQQKTRQGVVVSSKPEKTITVRIDLVRSHPVYGKVVHETNTLHAHDERNEAGEGDVVRVVECRPLSRSKRWRLVEVVERAR